MDTTRIDKLISLYERRLVALKSLKGMLEDDPELAAEAFPALAPHALPHVGNAPKEGRRITQRERLMDYLKDGAWRTLPEMADAIGVGKASLAPHLYRERDLFESRKHPHRPRLRQWRLKQKPEGARDAG
jgi:hypothetical protein